MHPAGRNTWEVENMPAIDAGSPGDPPLSLAHLRTHGTPPYVPIAPIDTPSKNYMADGDRPP